MTKLSVNINKIATLRNARGTNVPNLLQFATDIQDFGADGITVHPRPDERHIKYDDVNELKPIINTEFNIEGYPNKKFIDLVRNVKPHQVTLVPDKPNAITSNNGWDTIKNYSFLKEIITELSLNSIRTSIFMDPNIKFIDSAAKTGANRIELYTEFYSKKFEINPNIAISNYISTANEAINFGLGINAGHDLNLKNIEFFSSRIPNLLEVSIGHALICESLYLGLENVINLYKSKLSKN
ncbi:MAG: pyridoxine 5'-phosphate synthase [Flavobacteriales bacterium]|nr:pyridoxine 5'-phosphate synthase [Flavobacteriales bacterium]